MTPCSCFVMLLRAMIFTLQVEGYESELCLRTVNRGQIPSSTAGRLAVKILVVDRHGDVAQSLRMVASMQWQEVEVFAATNGHYGLDLFFEHEPDIVLIALESPGLAGFELLAQIRQVTDTPVIVIDGPRDELTIVRALEQGADDYLIQPYGQLELLARIRAVLRRVYLPPPVHAIPDFVSDGLTIHFATREVAVDNRPIKLTPVEFSLLYHLARNQGRVLSHAALLARIDGANNHDGNDYLKVYISRLRAKLGDDAAHPRWIETVPRIGYRFRSRQSLPRQKQLPALEAAGA